MNCRELIDFLSEYLDGELSAEQKADFDAHLTACPFCRDYLDSYRKTMELEKQAFSDMPDPATNQVPPEIVNAILQARRQKSQSSR